MKIPPSLTTVTPFSKLLAGVLFVTFIISAFFAGMIYQGKIDLSAYQQSNLVTANPSPTPNPTANWKTYTNNVGKFTIEYPSGWTLEETHERSNRVVDDPKEINTATLSGKEGQITLQWGPMGFGGGCDEKDHKTLQLKDASIQVCNGTNSNGEYWSQIYPPKNHEPAFGASATGIPGSKSLIEKIFSTLSFY